MVFPGQNLQFAGETGWICGIGSSQEDATPGRWIIACRVATGCRSRSNAPNVKHFVWMYSFENAIQAATAGPLLCYESDGGRAGFFRRLDLGSNLQQYLGTEPVTYGRSRPSLTDGESLPLQRHGIQEVYSRGPHLLTALRPDINVDFIQVRHFGCGQA